MAKLASILVAALASAALPAVCAGQNLVPQPGVTQPVAPPTAKSAPAPSTPLSGLVVQAPAQRRPCGARDEACQVTVIAEIWKRFPKEIETWCTAEQTRRTRERFALADLLGDDQLAASSSADFNSSLPEAEKRLCQPALKARFVDGPFTGKRAQAAPSDTAATKAAPRSDADADAK